MAVNVLAQCCNRKKRQMSWKQSMVEQAGASWWNEHRAKLWAFDSGVDANFYIIHKSIATHTFLCKCFGHLFLLLAAEPASADSQSGYWLRSHFAHPQTTDTCQHGSSSSHFRFASQCAIFPKPNDTNLLRINKLNGIENSERGCERRRHNGKKTFLSNAVRSWEAKAQATMFVLEIF